MAVLSNTNPECACAHGGVTKFVINDKKVEYGQIESYWPSSEDNETVPVYVNEGEPVQMYQHVHVDYWKPGTRDKQTVTLHGTSAFCVQSCKPAHIKNLFFINPLEYFIII